MQPIIWIAIIGVAASGLGMGFLAPGFDLVVQQVGAKHTLLETPINTAYIDFVVSAIEGVNLDGKTVFKNRITQCSFETPTFLAESSVVICKLSDEDGDIVAEGRLDIGSNGLAANTVTYIKIDTVAFENANEIQDVEDVKIIVLGPEPHAP